MLTVDRNGVSVGVIFKKASCSPSCIDSSGLPIILKSTGTRFWAYILHLDGRVRGKREEKHSKATQTDLDSPF